MPFSLEIDLLDRMLNFEIADDPTYSGLEIQGFDDPVHGTGIAVLLMRRVDGGVDVYLEPGLDLDRRNYEIGGGLRAWIPTDFETARLAVAPRGVDAEVVFDDADGRRIEVMAGDRTRRVRRMARFLAPMSADIAKPRSLPLVWMSGFDLLRRSGPDPLIRIDGRRATPGRLPAEWLLRRRLVKVARDLAVVHLNRTGDDSWTRAPGEAEWDADGLASLRAASGEHEAVLAFDPPFPSGSEPPARTVNGAWALDIDGMPVIAGTWRAEPDGTTTRVVIEVTQGWEPRDLPPLMAIVTRVAPVFRRWPTTYRWTATVHHGPEATVDSRWERTETDVAASYRSLSGTD